MTTTTDRTAAKFSTLDALSCHVIRTQLATVPQYQAATWAQRRQLCNLAAAVYGQKAGALAAFMAELGTWETARMYLAAVNHDAQWAGVTVAAVA